MTFGGPEEAEKRLQILGEEERKAIYGIPCFTPEEQTKYFSLSQPEKEALQEFRSVRSKAYFILQLGYFKAKNRFFPLRLRDAAADLHYVLRHHFVGRELTGPDRIAKRARRRQQQLILKLCGYRLCAAPERERLAQQAQQAARVCGKPLYLFCELMRSLAEERIVAPGYRFFQDAIGSAIAREQERLTGVLRTHLEPAGREALKSLLEDSESLYEITLLKYEPKDFTPGEIKREIRRADKMAGLYLLAKTLLPLLNISPESVKYYASLVTFYSVYRLKRFEEDIAHLYLLCFIYHRSQRLRDNLINCFLYHVRCFSDEAKAAAKDRVYAYAAENNVNLQKAGLVLKLFTDDRFGDAAPFREVRQQAFTILERDKLAVIADRISANTGFDETAFEWEHIDALAPQFKGKLRPLLLAVDFTAVSAREPLMAAVTFLREAFQKGRPLSQYPLDAVPTAFIPDSAKRYLYAKDERGRKRLIADRYEFLVCRQLRDGLEAVDISCRDSVHYRSFDDDLIDAELWRQNKEELIAATGRSVLAIPIREQLAALKELLEKRLTEVNGHIQSGENKYFKIKRNGENTHWTLQGLPASEPVNDPAFDALPQTDIADVLRFVHRECGFLSAFGHVLGRYAKQEPEQDILIASLIAWGTNLGLWRMGAVSDIPFHILSATSDNFIRLETLKAASDVICNAIAQLAIFRQYDIGGKLHSSSDGQKYGTQIDTVNARHSPKYFGLGKGIVSYNFVINHLSPGTQVIGAHEHESRFVFDTLANNTTDIRPDMHSTDSHGINAVNFLLLHLLYGCQFAPRHSDIRDKVRTSLYGFQHPTKYDEQWLLKPIRKLNEELIEEEWDNCLRILVSLAMKTTTQSIIVGKLSSHSHRNKTKRALWEYDHIIESLYLLDYVDSASRRKHVHQALNRGESYHKLRRAVSYANFGKLRFKTEYEQEIWNECARLISNCSIFYNATILSRLWEYRKNIGDEKGAAEILKISPVAWQCFNFCGHFAFRGRSEVIDIEAIVQRLAQILITPNPTEGHDP